MTGSGSGWGAWRRSPSVRRSCCASRLRACCTSSSSGDSSSCSRRSWSRIGEGLVPGFSFAFLGPLYPPLVFLQDLVGVAGRHRGPGVDRPPAASAAAEAPAGRGACEMGRDPDPRADPLVMVTMFGQNAARDRAVRRGCTQQRVCLCRSRRSVCGSGPPAVSTSGSTLLLGAHACRPRIS